MDLIVRIETIKTVIKIVLIVISFIFPNILIEVQNKWQLK